MYVTTPALWPALAVFLILAVPLLITDARHQRLPLPVNLGLLGGGLAVLAIASFPLDLGAGRFYGALLAAGAATMVMLVLFVVAAGQLGFGDVILTAGLALYAGYNTPVLPFAAIVVGCLLTLVHGRIAHRGKPGGPVPFGPGLIVGTLLALLVPAL